MARNIRVLNESSLFASLHPQLPRLAGQVRRALDLGCGDHPVFGDALISNCCICADVSAFQHAFPAVVCDGRALPFADYSLDLVISRVALPYMNVPKALREIYRVMAHSGHLWATLHLPRMALRRIRHDIVHLKLVDAIYQSCAIANGFLLMFSSLQLPWFGGRFESVQTPVSIHAALTRAGFVEIRTEICADGRGGRHFGVRAEKP
jgi:SAM-dependent methyltransferase